MNIAIITGASSGMGREFAKQIDKSFTKSVDEIWLIARRKERLAEVAETLQKKTRLLCMDITEEHSIQQFKKTLAEASPNVRMLVNCAGVGLLGDFKENSLEEQLGMLELNCTALTQITYQVLPYMQRNGRIIQLASSAAFMPQPDFAIYAASKAYVRSFSYALGEELRKDGIYVTAVCPGPVRTEFFDVAEKYGKTMAIKKLTMAAPEKVVKAALTASAYKRSISVYSPIIKLFHVITKLLPTRFLLAVFRVLKSLQ